MSPHDGGGHLAHLPMLLVPAVAAVGALVSDRRRRHVESSRFAALTFVVAAATAAAAAIHALVAPEHFTEWAPYGVFFVLAAVGQGVYAGWVAVRPARTVVTVGAVGNAAIVVLWLVTRLVGLPIGPEPGQTEAFGLLDVLSSVLEVAAVVGALALTARAGWRSVDACRTTAPSATSRASGTRSSASLTGASTPRS